MPHGRNPKIHFPMLQIDVIEARVLGSLFEKKATTPAYDYHSAFLPASVASQRSGIPCSLKTRLNVATEAFAGDPFEKTAAAMESVAMAIAAGEVLCEGYADAVVHMRLQAHDKLRPVALALLDRAEKPWPLTSRPPGPP